MEATLHEVHLWLMADSKRELSKEQGAELLERWLEEGNLIEGGQYKENELRMRLLERLMARGLDLNEPLPNSGLAPMVWVLRNPALFVHQVAGETYDITGPHLLHSAGASLWAWAGRDRHKRVIEELEASARDDFDRWWRSPDVQRRLEVEQLREATSAASSGAAKPRL